MSTMKVNPAHEKFIRSFAKSRELSVEEGLEKILNIAQSRLKALSNYAGSAPKKSKKASKKVAKAKPVAKAKSVKKAASAKAPKARKASASSKSNGGVPKGFEEKPNSTPAPEAQETTAAPAN